MGPRITTWNVNGIRNPFSYQPWRDRRTFEGMFDVLEADIVIIQELKIQRKDLTDDMVLVPGWDCFFSLPKHKKGYSGVGIYTRQTTCAPMRAEEGLLGVLKAPGSSVAYRDMPTDQCIGGYPTDDQIEQFGIDADELDLEGRCMVLEFPAFVLFGIYSPANSNGLRDNFRYGFVCALDARIRNLIAMGKRVVVTGDLNVSSEEIDSAHAEESIRKEGLTSDEYLSMPNRRIFNQLLLDAKVVEPRDEGREQPVMWDICRGFHKGRRGMYTHWEQKTNARPGNFGARIDFVLCSLSMREWFSESNIQEGLMGSDHCPVYAILKDTVTIDGEDKNILDIMNPPGVFTDGERIRELIPSDSLPQSGRLLPDFHRRQNIKDMFVRKSTPAIKPPVPTPPFSPEKQSSANTEKRKLAASRTPPKPVKRGKAGNGADTSKGQQSMKAFFKPKSTGRADRSPTRDSGSQSQSSVATTQSASTTSFELTSDIPLPTTAESEMVFDPIVNKESWDTLFTKKAPPLCEGHQEPCKSYSTKKNGINRGRWFWLCPRPLGPSGDKEVGTQWRCKTFIWDSERGQTQ